ncbi:VOC family protein [Enterovibrio sp. ZSDZ35]|uniref:VOC family protein n=1 Tax=Enterovibrio qingdaonensis TaxID=2899818 RepID=A0ABT5QK66_9GAMM|nr:VOC family protein [Enterovibrio sp. ZSDZ35]MDD1781385.1 VOC family protein [Enterovibrio sp. ZSDZ35]
MIFRYTILYVEDVARTLSFYEEAFGLTRGFLHESGDYGELITGETKLAFSSMTLMKELGKNPKPLDASSSSFEIAFETDDVKAKLAKAIDAGAVLVQDVEHMPWGQTTAYVRDINGTLVEICTPVTP